MSQVVYLDATALVKLVVQERESDGLREYLRRRLERATSIIGVIETRRAAVRLGGPDGRHLDFLLGSFDVADVDSRIAFTASHARPPQLPTLDAIHLASAMELGSDLQSLVTYDSRLASAARDLGLPVDSPA